MSRQHDVATWVTRIQAEYREMPGLQLTEPQMQRLWCFDSVTFAAILEALTTQRILVRTLNDTYVRGDRGSEKS
jgi:hypothetical protein